jgi:hypothetical protein
MTQVESEHHNGEKYLMTSPCRKMALFSFDLTLTTTLYRIRSSSNSEEKQILFSLHNGRGNDDDRRTRDTQIYGVKFPLVNLSIPDACYVDGDDDYDLSEPFSLLRRRHPKGRTWSC